MVDKREGGKDTVHQRVITIRFYLPLLSHFDQKDKTGNIPNLAQE